jgi:hypothetical protein
MKTVVAVQLAVIAIFGVIGAFAWPYVINEWLVFFGKEASVVWWQGLILGLIPALGQLGLPGAVITWIAMMFL